MQSQQGGGRQLSFQEQLALHGVTDDLPATPQAGTFGRPTSLSFEEQLVQAGIPPSQIAREEAEIAAQRDAKAPSFEEQLAAAEAKAIHATGARQQQQQTASSESATFAPHVPPSPAGMGAQERWAQRPGPAAHSKAPSYPRHPAPVKPFEPPPPLKNPRRWGPPPSRAPPDRPTTNGSSATAHPAASAPPPPPPPARPRPAPAPALASTESSDEEPLAKPKPKRPFTQAPAPASAESSTESSSDEPLAKPTLKPSGASFQPGKPTKDPKGRRREASTKPKDNKKLREMAREFNEEQEKQAAQQHKEHEYVIKNVPWDCPPVNPAYNVEEQLDRIDAFAAKASQEGYTLFEEEVELMGHTLMRWVIVGPDEEEEEELWIMGGVMRFSRRPPQAVATPQGRQWARAVLGNIVAVLDGLAVALGLANYVALAFVHWDAANVPMNQWAPLNPAGVVPLQNQGYFMLQILDQLDFLIVMSVLGVGGALVFGGGPCGCGCERQHGITPVPLKAEDEDDVEAGEGEGEAGKGEAGKGEAGKGKGGKGKGKADEPEVGKAPHGATEDTFLFFLVAVPSGTDVLVTTQRHINEARKKDAIHSYDLKTATHLPSTEKEVAEFLVQEAALGIDARMGLGRKMAKSMKKVRTNWTRNGGFIQRKRHHAGPAPAKRKLRRHFPWPVQTPEARRRAAAAAAAEQEEEEDLPPNEEDMETDTDEPMATRAGQKRPAPGSSSEEEDELEVDEGEELVGKGGKGGRVDYRRRGEQNGIINLLADEAIEGDLRDGHGARIYQCGQRGCLHLGTTQNMLLHRSSRYCRGVDPNDATYIGPGWTDAEVRHFIVEKNPSKKLCRNPHCYFASNNIRHHLRKCRPSSVAYRGKGWIGERPFYLAPDPIFVNSLWPLPDEARPARPYTYGHTGSSSKKAKVV